MRSRFIRRAVIVASASALAIPLFGTVASAAPDGSTSDVPGAVPAWAQPARATSTPAASQKVSFSIALSLRDADAAEKLATAVADPSSSQYGHFLTPDQFNAKFAPTDAQVSRVRNFLTSQGFTVDGVAEGNRWVSASGTVEKVNKAFHTQMKTYLWRGRHLKAPSKSVAVPTSVRQDILAVSDLDDAATLRRPASRKAADVKPAAPAATQPTPLKCSSFWGQNTQTLPQAYGKTSFPTYICGYDPDQLQTAYGVKQNLISGQDGRGVTVAIIDAYASPTMFADANATSKNFGQQPLAKSQYTEKTFKPFDLQDECGGEEGWNGEESLDVEAVHGVAPGAKIQYVGARNCDTGIDEAANWVIQHKAADLVSNSYGSQGEDLPAADLAKQHAMYVQAAAEGIGFYFSSGDSGDEVTLGNTPSAQPDYPASDPFVTAVGGTSLAVDAAGQYQWETGWGTDVARVDYTKTPAAYSAAPPGAFLFGAGGGVSTNFNQPRYQKGKVPAALSRQYGGAAMRVVPDVAAVADPYTGMAYGETVNGTFTIDSIGGTSLACPVFSAIQALASTGRRSPIGFANPLLYNLKSSVFHDVVPQRVPVAVATPSGSALVTFDHDSTLATSYGFDDVTGLGSPRGSAYLKAVKNGG